MSTASRQETMQRAVFMTVAEGEIIWFAAYSAAGGLYAAVSRGAAFIPTTPGCRCSDPRNQ